MNFQLEVPRNKTGGMGGESMHQIFHEFGDGEVRATRVSWLFYSHLFLAFQAKEIYLKAKSNNILPLQF